MEIEIKQQHELSSWLILLTEYIQYTIEISSFIAIRALW